MSTPKLSLIHPSVVVVLRLLIEEPRTTDEMGMLVRYSRRGATHIIEWLYDAGYIYVWGWRHSSRGKPARIWKAGRWKKDVPFHKYSKKNIKKRFRQKEANYKRPLLAGRW